jgi:aminoglycoside phosphotransferase (APT) family kinase protein
LDELGARLRAAGVVDVRPLTGGASSLTFSGSAAKRRVVIKVAPPGISPTLNRDVLRQSRVIRALRSTAVPVPEVLWEDAGAPPDIPPLFVMSFVDGSSFEPLYDLEGDDTGAEVMAVRQTNAARTLADLHRLTPGSLDLGDVPIAAPQDEIDRWSRALHTVDPELIAGWEGVREMLMTSVPAPCPPSLVHGDFRLGNLLAVGARITAVVDWEIWSLNDPRVDLGWFLLNGDPDTYRRETRYAKSMPSPSELVAAYGDSFGAHPADLPWFVALAAFKSVATWSLILKHNRRRAVPDPDVEMLTPVLPRFLGRARTLLG